MPKTPPPPPPPLLAAHLELDAKELQQAALRLSDEDKRDLLALVLDSMAAEEPTVEDAHDLLADSNSWRAQTPEVFALALVARVIGKGIKVGDIGAQILEYTAGHTPAKQHALKQSLRLAFSIIVETAQQAGRRL